MNDLWKTFGYFTWKYSPDFWCLCGGGDYIWTYVNKPALIEDLKALRRYDINMNYNGFQMLEVNGPFGPIRIL